MFGGSTLSLPESFAREHQPLRWATESSRPQPTGECYHQVTDPTGTAAASNPTCACQSYQHNRGAPGNVCDCGHAACYHAHAPSARYSVGPASPKMDLAERVKKLEDLIHAEQRSREHEIARERQIWDRDIRILREALAPFYQNEAALQRRLHEVEDKLDLAADEQSRLRERMRLMHQASVGRLPTATLDTLVERPREHSPGRKTTAHSDDVPSLSRSGDEHSSATSRSSSSRHPTPSDHTTTITEPDSPRSSGILDLVHLPRAPLPLHTTSRRGTTTTPPPAPPSTTALATVAEPRSSGFLGVDVKEPRRHRADRPHQPAAHHHVAHGIHKASTLSTTASSPLSARHSTPRSLSRPSPPAGGRVDDDHRSLRGRCSSVTSSATLSGAGTLALDVLANVSAASPSLS